MAEAYIARLETYANRGGDLKQALDNDRSTGVAVLCAGPRRENYRRLGQAPLLLGTIRQTRQKLGILRRFVRMWLLCFRLSEAIPALFCK